MIIRIDQECGSCAIESLKSWDSPWANDSAMLRSPDPFLSRPTQKKEKGLATRE